MGWVRARALRIKCGVKSRRIRGRSGGFHPVGVESQGARNPRPPPNRPPTPKAHRVDQRGAVEADEPLAQALRCLVAEARVPAHVEHPPRAQAPLARERAFKRIAVQEDVLKPRKLGEKGRQRPRDVVAREDELLEVGERRELGRDGPGEAVAAQVEDPQRGEVRERGRQRAAHGVPLGDAHVAEVQLQAGGWVVGLGWVVGGKGWGLGRAARGAGFGGFRTRSPALVLGAWNARALVL